MPSTARLNIGNAYRTPLAHGAENVTEHVAIPLRVKQLVVRVEIAELTLGGSLLDDNQTRDRREL